MQHLRAQFSQAYKRLAQSAELYSLPWELLFLKKCPAVLAHSEVHDFTFIICFIVSKITSTSILVGVSSSRSPPPPNSSTHYPKITSDSKEQPLNNVQKMQSRHKVLNKGSSWCHKGLVLNPFQVSEVHRTTALVWALEKHVVSKFRIMRVWARKEDQTFVWVATNRWRPVK